MPTQICHTPPTTNHRDRPCGHSKLPTTVIPWLQLPVNWTGRSNPCDATPRQPRAGPHAAGQESGTFEPKQPTWTAANTTGCKWQRKPSPQVKHQKPFISYQRLRAPLYKYPVATPCQYPVLTHISGITLEQWQILNTLHFALILERLRRVGRNFIRVCPINDFRRQNALW